MKWLKRILAAAVLLLAIAAVLPFLITLNDYIPQIEKVASQQLGESVSIKSIRFIALPLPHVTIEGITVGKSAELTVGKIKVTPDMYSLVHSPRVIDSIEVDSLYLGPEAIRKIPAWVGQGTVGTAEQAQIARIKSVRFSNASMALGKTGFGPFDASVELDAQSSPEKISVATRDGKIKVQILAGKSAYQVDASAKAWVLPVYPALLFDELHVRGNVTTAEAQITDLTARLYGGAVSGRANVNWQNELQVNGNLDISQMELQNIAPILSPGTHLSGRLDAHVRGKVTAAEAQISDLSARLYGGAIAGKVNVNWQKGLRIDGNLEISQMELQNIVPMLSPGTHLSGRLDAKPVFSASGQTREQLLDGLSLETPFSVKDGVLGGVDIRKATSSLDKKGATGGETRFEQLSGNLSVDRDGYHFEQLKITSGNLAADGDVDVSRQMQLSGRINGHLTGLSVPLTVAGTVDKPSLYPSGASMTGAAIGTMILGPGVGTSVGAKVGGWIDNLFSSKKDKKKEKKKAGSK